MPKMGLEVTKNVTSGRKMKNQDFLWQLYKRSQSVFSAGKILRLRRRIYAKENFEPLELANKIYAPSYISLETVLRKKGIVFQETAAIFAASYLTRQIECSGQKIFYRKIKDEVLINSVGIEKKENYFLASGERAFLDAVFVYKNYHFDNLMSLDWEKVFALVKIYKSKALEKRVKEYYQICQEENV